ncbi:Putative phosphatase YwpJ [Paraliobacillus sp. PM-2]|uniref:Cof-type HAD-IIB family hydrolase n=1 Tax=Paraliobacillus sp. PM-2 TaxID=1462524 RepID=UPI00061C1040|nr:Cof-type HAD-IIB family hydrolase [Paraliobacillus sp. PM-2]CQR45921.1 Putative phosphatase YwpJ [Paraliobacillus sp. PM-2]
MKLIAIDLDGTLLNGDCEVSDKNIDAIHRAINKGIDIVIVTGRPFIAAKSLLNKVGLSLPIISLNGAVIYSNKEEVIEITPMNLSISQQILTIFQENKIYTEIYTNKGTYSINKKDVINNIMVRANSHIEKNVALQRANQRIEVEKVKFIEDYNTLITLEDIYIYKIQGFSLKQKLLRRMCSQLNTEDIIITSSGNISIEINHVDAQKGIALCMFARDKGIQMKDTMAIGDNLNDISMLNIVGQSVAMGNADNEIKKVCHYTTKNNNEDGVAFAIEKVLSK